MAHHPLGMRKSLEREYNNNTNVSGNSIENGCSKVRVYARLCTTTTLHGYLYIMHEMSILSLYYFTILFNC